VDKVKTKGITKRFIHRCEKCGYETEHEVSLSDIIEEDVKKDIERMQTSDEIAYNDNTDNEIFDYTHR